MGIRIYQAAVFLSAFLLFLVQPMASKMLLPSFGGSYLVWGGCMAFFQAVLLLGYLYAHVVPRRLGTARYARRHWLLLLAAFAAFPFRTGILERFAPGGHPALDVVLLLSLLVGLPFLALSTMSVMLQKWLSASRLPERENPYVLYSPSNLGSMSALLCYPTVIEPFLDLRQQAHLWWAGFALLFLLQFACRPMENDGGPAADPPPGPPPPRGEMFRWFLLSAAGAASLLAVTNVITFDVASAPFLWILPLSAYLLSFVLVFKRRPWFPKWMGDGFNWFVALGALLSILPSWRMTVPVPAALALHTIILFGICMNCHGLLAGRKPSDPGRMTLFYLILALGGFCGSAAVSWVVPLASGSLVEYPLALMLALAAAGAGAAESRKGGLGAAAIGAAVLVAAPIAVPAFLGIRLRLELPVVMAASLLPVLLVIRFFKDRPLHLAALFAVLLPASLYTETVLFGTENVSRRRNFYGIYKVYDRGGVRNLKHGSTLHGREYLDPARAGIPLSYYHPSGPAGELLSSGLVPLRRAGMIGLGTGAMAMYFRDGQELTVFELDPDNLAIAGNRFRYLELARANGAKVRTVFGDGRLSLGKEPDRRFDLLIVDAFSSGAIPMHLLTREAFSGYMRVLGPDGLLLIHLSNRTLDLEPLVFSVARSLGLPAVFKSGGNADNEADESDWMVVTRNRDIAEMLGKRLRWRGVRPGAEPLPEPWTDRYGNLLAPMLRKQFLSGTR